MALTSGEIRGSGRQMTAAERRNAATRSTQRAASTDNQPVNRATSSYSPPPQRAESPYIPPQRAYTPYTPIQQYPVNSGGGGGGQSPATYDAQPAPQPQPKPVLSPAQWKAGDTALVAQNSELDNNYKDFLSRLNTQRGDFTRDFDVAKKGFDRNEAQGLLGLGEDFTSRGLANSGLFANANQEATANYQNQRDSMGNSRTRALADFTNQETEKKKATELARKNNESASLARMAQAQMF